MCRLPWAEGTGVCAWGVPNLGLSITVRGVPGLDPATLGPVLAGLGDAASPEKLTFGPTLGEVLLAFPYEQILTVSTAGGGGDTTDPAPSGCCAVCIR